MLWRSCARCGRELMAGEACACPAHASQLAWAPAGGKDGFCAEFVKSPVARVGEVALPSDERLGALVWDLKWLSGQDPWRNAGEEPGAAASVAFFGYYEGRPFVLHDVRGRGPVLFLAGAPDLGGQDVFDAMFAALARRPWSGHAEPARAM